MRRSRHSAALLALALSVCLPLAGCGKSSPPARNAQAIVPVARQGAVSVVTRNTSRIGGADPATDAAAVARAVFPGLTAATRPDAVVIVDVSDWPAALAASSLAGGAVGAPILYGGRTSLPGITVEAIEALRPHGLSALGGTQVIRVGSHASTARGLSTRTLPAGAPATVAAEVAELLREASGGVGAKQVIVVPEQAPRAMTMPVAGLAAESAAPILYTGGSVVPPATLHVLGGLKGPSIYVADPAAVGSAAMNVLRRYGRVTTIGAAEGASPVANAIAIARYTDGSFGWGIKEPGHGLVFASETRPLDAPAAALLSASADYGPLLLLESPASLPLALSHYLSDIQPAYSSAPQYQPVRGAYNHGWLIGGEDAISAVAQAEIDSLLEISPTASPEATSGAPPE